jgi:peptidoglycan/xylan/chitin deacetylase (PgdA/CDA1 family)
MSPLLATPGKPAGTRRALLNLAAGALWYLQRPFSVASFLGPRYSLRCVLFHDVSDTESLFTRGLGVTSTRKNFQAALEFIARNYTPVSLQDVIADFGGRTPPPRPVLLTFDDAYASVSEFAAPLCSKFGVPAVFFVNAECLNNRRLALDNLVCYVANLFGLETINAAIHAAAGLEHRDVRTLAELFAGFLPGVSLSDRKNFRDGLVRLTQISESDVAAEAALYLSSQQLRDLHRFDFEIGDHTYSHVNCRSLLAGEFAEEIDRNRAVLEGISGRKIRTFSVPYGSDADLTTQLLPHLQRSGYEALFLAEGCSNSPHTSRLCLDRVSVKAVGNAALFSEIEVLPRLRTTRNRLLVPWWGSRRNSSHWKTAMPTTWNYPPGKDTGAGAAVPRNPLG